MGRFCIEFRAVCTSKASHVPCKLDDSYLHSKADAKIGNSRLARIADRSDLALDTSLTEPAGNQDRVDVVQHGLGIFSNVLGIKIMNFDFGPSLDSSMNQGFGQ